MTISWGRCAALALVLALPSGCAEELEAPEPPLRPVRWVAARLTDGVRGRSFSGSAKAATESTLSFKVSGTLQRRAVEVGDRVSAGQLIAELDPRDYELQVQEASAALADAEAQAREAAANHERYRLLYETDNTSKSEYDAARAADESAAAAVTAARKRLEIAELQLSYTRLLAPVDGAISATRAEVNENVAQGAGIVDMTSGALIEVEVAVPGVLIQQVDLGASCTISFDALPGRRFDGRIIEVGVASTGLQTTFPVKARMLEKVPEILPGMAALVRLQLAPSDPRPRALVPGVAVGEDRSGRFVYVVLDDGPGTGRVERREVVIGDMTEAGELEVFEGLADGERVVIRGMSKLTDGEAVQLPESGAGL